jgi:hypothetical protein
MQHKMQVMISIICMMVIFAAMCIILASNAKAYDGEQITTKKQVALHLAADMLRAVGFSDDSDPIKALSAAWWQEWEDLSIIAKTIQHEANPEYCEWEHSLAVGVVILNRVASPYFHGDTVKEVVAWPGQYLPSYTWGFENVPRLCYEAAKAVMDGDHDIPSDVYWQAEFPQGVSIWKTFEVDTGYYHSLTYICRGIPGVS